MVLDWLNGHPSWSSRIEVHKTSPIALLPYINAFTAANEHRSYSELRLLLTREYNSHSNNCASQTALAFFNVSHCSLHLFHLDYTFTHRTEITAIWILWFHPHDANFWSRRTFPQNWFLR